jgi:plastocyanin
MNTRHIGRKNAVSVTLAVALAVCVVLIILGVGYIVLVLPGSIAPSTSTNTSATTVSIAEVTNLPLSYSYTNIYIPAGAAIEGSVANFNPQSVTVAVGVNNTVIWTNLDAAVQMVSGSGFSSGNLTEGQSWNYTFTTPGTYPFTDPYYQWLSGTVTVVSGS